MVGRSRSPRVDGLGFPLGSVGLQAEAEEFAESRRRIEETYGAHLRAFMRHRTLGHLSDAYFYLRLVRALP